MTVDKKEGRDRVAMLRAKLEKATPGVWAISNGGEVAAYPGDHALPDTVLGDTEWRIEDEELACEAVNALPDLLSLVDIAKRVFDRLDHDGVVDMGEKYALEKALERLGR